MKKVIGRIFGVVITLVLAIVILIIICYDEYKSKKQLSGDFYVVVHESSPGYSLVNTSDEDLNLLGYVKYIKGNDSVILIKTHIDIVDSLYLIDVKKDKYREDFQRLDYPAFDSIANHLNASYEYTY